MIGSDLDFEKAPEAFMDKKTNSENHSASANFDRKPKIHQGFLGVIPEEAEIEYYEKYMTSFKKTS